MLAGMAVGSLVGFGSTPPPPRAVPLPPEFAGWQKSLSQTSSDPAVADPVSAPVIREYGFTDFERATYTREGREMKVKAARFADTSGAYGAFTFYKVPEMLTEKFGDQGAALNNRVLFYRGNILVEATLDQITAMSAAELRQLSESLPTISGPAGNLPTLPQYLPKQAYVKNSAKYVLGPAGLQAAGTPVPADQVEFTRGAEVAEGKYLTSRGTATLMLISYPTPQIAGERLRALAALGENASSASDTSLSPPFVTKRTGPIVALVAGQISQGEAKSLLASVNYDANVTWNENTFLDKKNNVANFLVNVIFLVVIIVGFALVAGFAFGGVRLLVKRALPGRIFDRTQDMEIIQLNLGSSGRRN
jgi:hypothetical protein